MQSLFQAPNRMHLYNTRTQEAREKVGCRSIAFFLGSPASRETYLTTLEDRLNRMEAVMAQSGLSMPGKEPVGKESKPNSPPAAEDVDIQDIPDKMSLLKVFDDGTTLFIGKCFCYATSIMTYSFKVPRLDSPSSAIMA